jgi:hypothetical protein
MWTRWLPWRLIIRNLAKKHGFIDPIQLVSAINRMAQPSEVAAPVELLRLASVLHARGLINSQVIQNNLDWVWPYWVNRQFDPRNKSFIPRAFSLTHINLTHRNWTAVGIPGVDSLPIVDTRGLVTPLYDGWSIDSWLVAEDGYRLFPSGSDEVRQTLEMLDNLSVMTDVLDRKNYLTSRVEVETGGDDVVCKIRLTGSTERKGYLAVSLRPYNPEGVSFIHEVSSIPSGWEVNGKDKVFFETRYDRQVFSNYRKGDVAGGLFGPEEPKKAKCDVGLCTAAALFEIEPGAEKDITVAIPLNKNKKQIKRAHRIAREKWFDVVDPVTKLEVPDKKFKYLYDASIRNLILLSPEEVYAGPYTYKQFWFRDASYAIHAMLSVNLHKRAKNILDRFPERQTAAGYFKSQDGEWDSNGQVLWIMNRYCDLAGKKPDEKWERAIVNAMGWIQRKRMSGKRPKKCSGLFPAGFSAEHFGPNDYYYWDDFWGVAGLDAGKHLSGKMNSKDVPADCGPAKDLFLRAINESIAIAQKEQKISTIPASPLRRMDSSAVGTLAASYPLKIYEPDDKRIMSTVDYLLEKYLLDGLFFHEIAHSGINIYLSLQISQVLLRCGDPRYYDIAAAAADMSSDTGQWPEAIHPWTGGGCMGDGQHLWASSEWIMMMRNFFIREEKDKIILCSGIPEHWTTGDNDLFFGPAPTSFGDVSIKAKCSAGEVRVDVGANWRDKAPSVEVRMPGYKRAGLSQTENFVVLQKAA